MTPITKIDYLLSSLGEECGELQQAIGKALRFGLLDFNPYDLERKTNWVNLRQELHDIISVYELLCDEFDRVEEIDRDLIRLKKAKVDKWLKHAEELGRIEYGTP